MSYSGEAADQVVRLSLNGVEVAAKLSGSAAKQLAIMIYAILKDQKKTKGKIRLTNMLRSGKELKVFAVKDGDLQKFCQEAKKYGVLYCVLKDKNATDGITDIMVRAEDAAKVNRIFTRFGLATVDLASLKTELVKEQNKARTEEDADVRSGSDKSSDHFWEDMAAMLLKALISYLHYEAPPEEQNFPMVMDMIRAGDVKEDNEEYASTLDELFERLERKNPEHIAVRYYKGYYSGSGKTLKSIQITLISHLEKFNLTYLAGITQTDEMELGEIGERKTAVFAVIPDSDSSYNFIVGMLYTQLFQQLYRKADFEHGGRLPVHVHFVMDEFANVALPDDFDKLLATMRSREISVSIILQNLAQLKALFDKQWESIVGNCDTFLYLGGNEQSTHEYVSKLLGKQTIDTNTYGQSKGRSGSYTTNFQTAGRELMTPDEVRMLDNRYALLFIRGERPVKDLKYNILKHPNVALTTDGKAVAYQHGTDPLSVAAVSINLEKLKQAIPADTDTGDYVVLTEEEVYDFMRKKAQENNQNQNPNKHQEVTYEKHYPQHHSSHHPSDF